MKFQIPREDKPVTGIATIGNDLFVIRPGNAPKQIEVYDAETGTIRRSLPIPEHNITTSQLCCLAACGFHKCLYVSDDNIGCKFICKASMIKKNKTVKFSKFQVCQEITNRITSLAVNKDHNLLVACFNVKKLLEYTTGGVLARQVNLKISNPLHVSVAHLHTGLYGVIHQREQKYRYSVMDTNGEVVKRSPLIMMPHPMIPFEQVRKKYEDGESPFGSTPFVGSFRSTVTLEAVPSGLTAFRSGTVFIAARDGNKILVLCETGGAFKVESLPDVAYGGTLNQPHCVHFDDSKLRLYIGEWGGGRVLCCSAERK